MRRILQIIPDFSNGRAVAIAVLIVPVFVATLWLACELVLGCFTIE